MDKAPLSGTHRTFPVGLMAEIRGDYTFLCKLGRNYSLNHTGSRAQPPKIGPKLQNGLRQGSAWGSYTGVDSDNLTDSVSGSLK